MANKIGENVQNFYNKTPFPDYDLDNFNTKEDLEIDAYPFAKTLDKSIPKTASIIDCGTGTGQLSAFLSLKRDNVWGIDFSDSSLNKAKALREKLSLNTWGLYKVNLLDTEEINTLRKFDYVLSLGVLHHTGNAYLGFQNITNLMEQNGYIVIGLYNTYGRIFHKIRVFLAKTIFKNNNKVKDYFIKMQITDMSDKERVRGWWNDQYLHPHETCHSIGEVLGWFKKNNIKFIELIPTDCDYEITGIFNQQKVPNIIQRFWIQLKWVFTIHRDGGYFIMVGKK